VFHLILSEPAESFNMYFCTRVPPNSNPSVSRSNKRNSLLPAKS